MNVQKLESDATRIARVLSAQPRSVSILPRPASEAAPSSDSSHPSVVMALGPHAWIDVVTCLPLSYGKMGLEIDVDGDIDSVPPEWKAAFILASFLARDVEVDVSVELSLNVRANSTHQGDTIDASIEMSSSSSAKLVVSPSAYRRAIATSYKLAQPSRTDPLYVDELASMWHDGSADNALEVALHMACKVAAAYAATHLSKSGRVTFVNRDGGAPDIIGPARL